MGGKALKKIITKRCSLEEFKILSSELVSILKRTFEKVAIPRFYNSKESFGDIDILVCCESDYDMCDYIRKNFNPNEIIINDEVYSFDYKNVQIDIITTSEENFYTHLSFLDLNDLGNFIGKLAHTQGLKYGIEGLFYEHYFKGKNIGKILISKNQRKIYEFFGLSYDECLKGFNSLDDIFRFVSSSKFFNWKKFQLDELNSINRKRDMKRSSYLLFLEWIKDNVADKNHEYTTIETQEKKNKRIEEFFPESKLKMKIRQMEYDYTLELYLKSKFDGLEITKRFGLRGKELGQAMKDFRNVNNFERYILNNTEERIYTDFEKFLKNRNK